MRARRGLLTARRREQINRGRQTKSDYYSIPLFTVAQLPMEHLSLYIEVYAQAGRRPIVF